MTDDLELIRSLIRDVPDFPRPGIMFKDITPVVRDPRGLRAAADLMAAPFHDRGVTVVAGMESRGFIFGVSVAERLGVGFVPVRKPGKLPAATIREEYALEYGTDALEIHEGAVGPGDRVLVVDDLLATGGTAGATWHLIERAGAEVVAAVFLIELAFLGGRAKLEGREVHGLVVYR
jgi:adenine phosphoribosyltransferase